MALRLLEALLIASLSGIPAAQAAAGRTVSERVSAAVGQGLPAADLPPPAELPAPPQIKAAAPGPLFTEPVWSGLAAPDAATLAWLSSRIPDLKAQLVRELTPDAIDALLAEATARSQSPTDLFTDAGLRADRVFLARGEALSAAFGKYEVPVITLASGQDTNGRPFKMEALVLGTGRVDMLYDRNDFRIKNPYFSDNEYTLASRVSHGIQGPGDMTVEGVTVEMGWIRPKIQRFVKLSADRLRVETNWGSRERPVRPITRRP